MPTPSSDTRRPTTLDPTDDREDTLQFRAATLEEAIALAESSLGARVRVVAANRIRRGGIGGFFAADLGVEVTVALDDETMEQALERLVNDAAGTPGVAVAPATSAGDERMRFEDRLAAQESAATTRSNAAQDEPEQVAVTKPAASAIDPVALLGRRFDRRDDEPVSPVNPVLAEVVAAIVAEAAEKQALAAAAADTSEHGVVTTVDAGPEPALPAARSLATWSAPDVITPPVPPMRIVAPVVDEEPTTRPVYTAPPTMLKVEQIMAELSAITAEPVFGDRSRARVARPARREPVEPTDTIDAIEHVEPVEQIDQVEIIATHGAPEAREAREARHQAEAAPAPKIMPTLPPRASDVARRASDAAHAARTRFLTNQPPDLVPTHDATPAATPTASEVVTPVPVLTLAAEPTRAPAPGIATTELRIPATPAVAAPAAIVPADALGTVRTIDRSDPEVLRVEAVIEDHHLDHDLDHDQDHDRDHGPDHDEHALGPAGATPSQRQVELAVAATDQLIESLKREDGVKRLSVRVVLRTGDHREVEAEAEWEAS